MKKRLRKKLRKGEFAEYGFDLTVRLRPEADDDAWLDTLIAYVEARGLGVGGSTTNGFFVAALDGRRRKVTEDDRAEMAHWLNGESALQTFAVGRLQDAWWGKVDWWTKESSCGS